MALHPASPLFASLAARYVEENRPAQALKTCLQGMRYYPEYPTGLLLIARAQVMLRQYSDARETLHELLRILPACPAALRLLDRMTELELEYPPYTASAGSYFVRAGLNRDSSAGSGEQWSRQDDLLPSFDVHRETDDDTHRIPPDREEAESAVGKRSPDDSPAAGAGGGSGGFDLEGLASRLEKARIPVLPEEGTAEEADAEESPENVEAVNLEARPVTETLIEIYIQQGKLHEAIDACRRLAERHPDRREELSAKIHELEQRLEG